MGGPPADPLVLAIVGTDHHPFDRLVRWVDAWASGRGRGTRVVVQFGSSDPPVAAEGRDLLPVAELERLMRGSRAVVCHGGPGTIMGARSCGVVPIVVPRRSELGEHVDDHQVRFSRRLAHEGSVHLAGDGTELGDLLDRALAGEPGFRLDPTLHDPAAEATARLKVLVERMLARP
jgi:UDP-N-acetylglucosamine transferase subunit ALG13